MTVLVTGGRGLIGRALRHALAAEGESVRTLTRGVPRGAGEFHWDPATGRIDPAALAGADAVVHLAGESIAGGRWSPARRARIRESRVRGTRRIAEAVAARDDGPRVLISASAIGYYGDRGDAALGEGSGPGDGFLAETARQWEAATASAVARARVVTMRFGIVLTPRGGALAKMLTPFRLGLGGRFGSGRQWMSWIGFEDLMGAIRHALTCDALTGPVNATAPEPVRNAEFARVLGRVLGRPAWLPVPAFALRVLLGPQMAQELLLSSARVLPVRLLETGYAFRRPTLESALRHELQVRERG